MEERITKLESEVAELKRKRRDAWDIVHIIGTLLLPFAVAFAGYYYSRAMKNAEIAESLGISVKTVENQMTIALRKMREALTPYFGKDIVLLALSAGLSLIFIC